MTDIGRINFGAQPVWGPPAPCGLCADTQARVREALRERDTARAVADRQASLRRELAEALGVSHLEGETQFTAALRRVVHLQEHAKIREKARQGKYLIRETEYDALVARAEAAEAAIQRVRDLADVWQRLGLKTNIPHYDVDGTPIAWAIRTALAGE